LNNPVLLNWRSMPCLIAKYVKKTKYLKTALVLLVDRRYYSLVIGGFF
jgi:hypothetical protein